MRGRRWSLPTGDYFESTTRVRVRFQEVDSLRVVWHGHYVTYLEEGRTAFGREYAFDYSDILSAGFIAPLVHVEIDFISPARYGDVLTIRTRLHPSEGSRIDFSYVITDGAGSRLATAFTVQLFTEPDGSVVLTRPAFVDRFLATHRDRLIRA